VLITNTGKTELDNNARLENRTFAANSVFFEPVIPFGHFTADGRVVIWWIERSDI